MCTETIRTADQTVTPRKMTATAPRPATRRWYLALITLERQREKAFGWKKDDYNGDEESRRPLYALKMMSYRRSDPIKSD